MDRCPNCMRMMENGRCPSCGAPQMNKLVNVRGALGCHTILEARYEIGNPLGSNVQAIAYIAYDNRRQEPVIVLEFFPARLVNRSDQQVVMRGRSDLYADACRRFVTSTMAQPLPLIDTFCANNTGYRVYKPKSGMYVVEAELLLDAPILFRNEMDQPVMSINALHIPPMPKQREWTLSRRLTRVKKRRTTRRIIAGAAAVVVLGIAGAVTWDTMREYDVTVRVHTEVPVVKASLGDQELPMATPDADHTVTYQTKLRKGSYVFSAENEHQLSSGKAPIIVNGPITRDVSIPTPSPAPIMAMENQWIYQEGDQRYIVTDTFEETDLPLDPAMKLHPVHLDSNAALADHNTSCKIVLYRDGVSRELVWKNGEIDFEVTAGSYELRLRMDDQELPLHKLEIAEDAEDTLNVPVDMEALAFYCDNVETLKEEKQLCYIADDSNRMISADAKQLNKWHKSYPQLFEEYRQYPILIEVDEHLKKDVSFTLNGRLWLPGQAVSTNAEVKELVIVATADGATHEDTVPLDHDEAGQTITIGRKLIAEADGWKDVQGLVIIGGETYLLRDGKEPEIADATMLDQLDRVLKLTDNLLAHDLSKRINVSVEQNQFIKPGIVTGVKVNGIPMQEEKDRFSATLTPGEYKFTACFSDGNEEDFCTEQIADEQNSTFTLLTNETTKAREANSKMKSSQVDAMIQTSKGYFLLPAENAATLEDVTAEDVRSFAATFTSSVFDDRWTLYPTEVSIDERVTPDAITGILMEGQPLKLKTAPTGIADIMRGKKRETGTSKVDLEYATAGTHHITVKLRDGTVSENELHVTAPSEDNPEGLNQLTLLKDWVDKRLTGMAFWGTDKNHLDPIASKDKETISMLTEKALQNYWDGETIHKLEIKVDFEIKDELTWELLHVPSGEKLPLVDITPEGFTLWLSAGEYELKAFNGEDVYLSKLVEMSQEELTLTEEDILMATPTPTPKRTPTPTPTRTPTQTPKRTPTRTPTPTPTRTSKPTGTPTTNPTDTPTTNPTETITTNPPETPTTNPTKTPTTNPPPTSTSTDISADATPMTSL